MRARVLLTVLCSALAPLAGTSSHAQERQTREEREERDPRADKESFEGGDDPANRAQFSQPATVEGYDLNGAAMQRFTGPAWSLVYPDRDYQGGCVIGFLAFRFSPTGYFVYNNRVRGSWRVDEMGNLLLRTKDGLKFTLIVEGTTLRPTGNLPFARKFYQFQRCPA
jgi:hypothetical protein